MSMYVCVSAWILTDVGWGEARKTRVEIMKIENSVASPPYNIHTYREW